MANGTLFQTSALSPRDIKNIIDFSGWKPEERIIYIAQQRKIIIRASEENWENPDENENSIFKYKQTINRDLNGLQQSSILFVDLDTDSSNFNIDNFDLIKDSWNLIDRAVCNTNGSITFYIYTDALPAVDIPISVTFLQPIIEGAIDIP